MFGVPSWLIQAGAGIAVILAIFFYGHHEGSLEGTAQVESIRQQMAENTAKFREEARAKEKANQEEVNKEKDSLNAQLQKQAVTINRLNTTVSSLRSDTNSYVAQIERLSGQDCTSSNTALALAYRQYDELADALRETSTRADNAAAIANTLNQYANAIQ
jgi:Skp family chaperone for outer membrane proteins